MTYIYKPKVAERNMYVLYKTDIVNARSASVGVRPKNVLKSLLKMWLIVITCFQENSYYNLGLPLKTTAERNIEIE